jgi:molybdopterin-containing oxidoreductase family membrane subunit
MAVHDPLHDPLLVGQPTNAALTTQLLSHLWTPQSRWWWVAFTIAAAGTVVLFSLILATFWYGIGLWGNNMPVAWAFGIINFVWWIGIGHAGTFISAILLVLEQKWRTSINRFAEAMTLFAVLQAGLFPLIHLGRPWFAYWLIPYPATMGVWPNFKSALPWDAAAVFTYLTVSFLFWYLGLVPDFATLRDRAPDRRRRLIYGVLAFGWYGSASAFRHYRMVYGLLGGLATPLVLSVHSIVSADFAITILPGWHSTIFPPLFVAGAILSGFALVLTLLLPSRAIFRLHNVVTAHHMDSMGKMLLVTAWIVIYSYMIEHFMAWYGGQHPEQYLFFKARPFEHGAIIFWAMMLGNVVVPQILWWRHARRTPWILWCVTILINVGMWSERYDIIVQSLQRDWLPSSWGDYSPTWVDLGIFGGTLCFFLLLFMSFLRLFPFIPISELKELSHEQREAVHEANAEAKT